MPQKKRPVAPDDILKLRIVGAPQVAPNGDKIVFSLMIVDRETNKYHRHLWIMDFDDGPPRQFTFGELSDSSPLWSPDGKQIAFIRTRDKVSQIHLISADGGEARPLTKLEPGVISGLSWSPDSEKLAFSYHPKDKGDPKDPEKAPAVRHITRLRYQEQGYGFLDAERDHIYVLNVADGKLTQLTEGDFDDQTPAWSPDGKTIAFVSNRHPDADYRLLEEDIWVVPAGGGNPKALPAPKGPKALPSWSPDGTTLAYFGHAHPEDSWGTRNMHLWVVPIKRSEAHEARAAKDLMPSFDRTVGDATISDTRSSHGPGTPPLWSTDGRYIYTLASDRGSCQLYRVPVKGGEPEPLTSGTHQVMGASLARRGELATLSIADPLNPGDVYVVSGLKPGSMPKQRTALNQELFHELALSEPEEFEFNSADGTAVQGWLLKPPGFDRKKKYPLVLEIHGGPHGQYGHSFFHEFQLLAAQGYVVLYTNPRGSQGAGEAFARAILNDWGNLDYQDIMAGVDTVLQQGFIDEKRMGVCGGSYGGYMTNWIVGHTHRFRAGITMRSVTNLYSMVGTSDIGYEDHREFGVHPWEDPERYWKQSPIAYVKNIKTPLLVIHSEDDRRCPIEQAEQLYIFLKAQKREVEFLRFPEETHELSRSGRPDRRVIRLEHIIRWFEKYLKEQK